MIISVWDLERRDMHGGGSGGGGGGAEEEMQPEAKRRRTSLPAQLMFQHAGHRSQVLFSWGPCIRAWL
jgi:hypothetical protein